MEKVYDNCYGIDMHKKLIVACFIHGKEQEICEFSATTRKILEMAAKGECQMVTMESIASYGKPLYNILKFSGLNAMVVNTWYMKIVPRRKMDIKDNEWIADLLQHGFLQTSYILDRELVNYRKNLI